MSTATATAATAATATPVTALRVALVGAGVIARTHARIAEAHDHLVLAAIIDPMLPAAQALAETSAHPEQPAVYASLAEALAADAFDLVVITTPSGSHAQLAEEALDAGCHVVIEKPVDIDLARARGLAARAEQSDRVVSVMTQRRFAPAVQAVSRAVRDGRFGAVTSGTATLAWWRDDAYYDSAAWRGTWASDGGGALMNQGIHTVDVLLSLMGRPVTVSGTAVTVAHDRLEVEDVAGAFIAFENGAVATLLASTAAFPENSTRVQVHGTRGSAYVQDGLLEYFHADDAHDGSPRGWARGGNQAASEVDAADLPGGEAPIPDLFDDHLRQYEDVIAAIREGREPAGSIGDAVQALAVIIAVYVSSALGHPVRVDDVLDGMYDCFDYKETRKI
ncbi:Gfo/Idh/MocA family protein [Microbacterium sp. SS28]|uniref:Gfo/Idh/MocA family protein n=1 Tax=Microbacterium sp. SS28 TaxID=2919948 RepID=UPI001FA98385|nr:Gfo/Idh/MocA family oxidoreductase [Microbacterium sp. SS28]